MNNERATTLIRFRGTYFRSDDQKEIVDLIIEPEILSSTETIWRKFGPFNVPFCQSDDRTGAFLGTIQALNVLRDTEEEFLQDGSLSIELHVLPSVVVGVFQPTELDCTTPSSVILDHIPYKSEVAAMGFTPTEFKYTLAPGVLMSPDPDEILFNYTDF